MAYLQPMVTSCATLIEVWKNDARRREGEDALSRLNVDLEQRTAQLEASNKDLEAFSYSVSHDLRAPLRAIDGFGRILKEDYASHLDAEGRRLLGVIASAGPGRVIRKRRP